MRVEFTDLFNKQRKEASLDIKIAFRESLEIFLEDSNNTVLRNHSLDTLGKKYFGIWSIDVTEDWRALYRKEQDRIIFIELGTHNKLYK
ncbi:MAG: type II toxin-antitoxin system mRNA interferase toxin, RelE/StbE family [Patescibacteria group bacterium]|nr:type II toxin-antitoxin system mRNA interferase toxin, RelE/StbE family [Patescibacteria group bacterium]MDE2588067.1 type II toxin-antitoxin system mRNA interferase toxin, RelE/StbE family [Patescibacteria group bacterium]